MGSKRDTFEADILKLIFQNVAITNIGDAGGLRATATAGNLYIALYTADPTDSTAGTETVYTNYARIAVVRSASGWTVAGTNPTNCSNAALITFATCGVTGATLTGFAICKAGTRDIDDQLYWGALTASLIVSAGITPEFAIGDLDVNED